MMWSDVILSILTSGSVVGIVEFISLRRRRASETKMTEYNSDKSGLELIQTYKDLVNESLVNQLSSIHQDIMEIKINVVNLKEYLNGPYQKWVENKYNKVKQDKLQS